MINTGSTAVTFSDYTMPEALPYPQHSHCRVSLSMPRVLDYLVIPSGTSALGSRALPRVTLSFALWRKDVSSGVVANLDYYLTQEGREAMTELRDALNHILDNQEFEG